MPGSKAEAMDDRSTGGSGLPASIELAWGLRERPAKGPRPALSLTQIVDAGVRVAATEGLAAVSMGRVAAELGASTMSLYRYVAAKDELLALMVDAAVGPPPPATSPEPGWRDGIASWAWAQLAVFRRHPWVLRVPIPGPPMTPNQVGWMEAGLWCLRGTGLHPAEQMSVILLVSGFVRTDAMLAADIAAALASGTTAPETVTSYGRLLRRLVDPDRFPALAAILATDTLDDESTSDPDEEFVFGLERVLDGVDVLVRARR